MGSWVQALIDFVAQFNPCFKISIWERGLRETYRPKDITIWSGGKFCWVHTDAHVVLADLGPGLHRRLPFFEVIHSGSVVLQPMSLKTQHVTSADGKSVSFAGNLAYRVTNYRNHVIKIHDFEHSIMVLAEIYLSGHIREHTWEYLSNNQSLVERSLRRVLNKAAKRWGARILTIGLVTLVQSKQYNLFNTQENRGPY